MSGVNFNSTSYSNRLTEIESALVNPKSDKKVNDSLELVNKENGFLRFLKIMVLPIARFFGADPFAHTRANKVATALLSQYQEFETELNAEDKNRLSNIITLLNQKTKGRYNKIMNVFINIIPVTVPEIKNITPLKPSNNETPTNITHSDKNTGEQTLNKIALECAKQGGSGTAEYIQNFAIEEQTDLGGKPPEPATPTTSPTQSNPSSNNIPPPPPPPPLTFQTSPSQNMSGFVSLAEALNNAFEANKEKGNNVVDNVEKDGSPQSTPSASNPADQLAAMMKTGPVKLKKVDPNNKIPKEEGANSTNPWAGALKNNGNNTPQGEGSSSQQNS